ncbi:hypothetical protein OF385_12430 [Glutamicibacter sp. JL.03c]|uniref:hypothetical protein n=1 Tax=Glutamicibacter sp. JL.03c TaxID=2984842 RepID=UPI0021F7E453|nr:hypothetical protein [Glutamicibacter sp. JL.03c]UYQ76819.1 hypothetical protein OF385_12430 [Glutamicibacter sp. JL.03c]
MNPLEPNAFELIVFYIVPVLFVVGLTFTIIFIAHTRKSTSFEFESDDKHEANDE